MKDLEISKALALAIGWDKSDTYMQSGEFTVLVYSEYHNGYYWRVFDYRDWNVIGPIAEKYNCFPSRSLGEWQSSIGYGTIYAAQTPQKAIALAVIGANK